ncbi:MAG: hypothetical protein B7Z40_22835 [Bosea sp. 12-68-7]|nr:MAG: hypothetical protein B7Z40_22835 [Bosea sp. 12-68-7]
MGFECGRDRRNAVLESDALRLRLFALLDLFRHRGHALDRGLLPGLLFAQMRLQGPRERTDLVTAHGQAGQPGGAALPLAQRPRHLDDRPDQPAILERDHQCDHQQAGGAEQALEPVRPRLLGLEPAGDVDQRVVEGAVHVLVHRRPLPHQLLPRGRAGLSADLVQQRLRLHGALADLALCGSGDRAHGLRHVVDEGPVFRPGERLVGEGVDPLEKSRGFLGP